MTAARIAGAAVIVLLLVTGCGRPPGARHEKSASTASATGAAAADGPTRATPVARKGDLQVIRPYLPRPPMRDMAAVYFTVHNTGARPDYLDRVEVPGLTRTATLHTTRNDTMVRVRDYRIPAHSTLVLHPGGNHVMLADLTRMPTVGTRTVARLFFRHTGEIDVNIPIVAQTSIPTSTHKQQTPTSNSGAEGTSR